MDIFTANNPDDLQKFMTSSKITNPHCGNVSKHEVEKWCMFRLLSTFYENKKLDFPISIEHDDKPDFRCKLPDRKAGVEITRATTEQYERARALRDKYYPEAPIELSHFKWGAPDKSTSEILGILKASQFHFSGPALYDNHIENEWVKGLAFCLSEKTKKLNQEEFSRFKEY